jgi:hypothetical protein
MLFLLIPSRASIRLRLLIIARRVAIAPLEDLVPIMNEALTDPLPTRALDTLTVYDHPDGYARTTNNERLHSRVPSLLL